MTNAMLLFDENPAAVFKAKNLKTSILGIFVFTQKEKLYLVIDRIKVS